MFNNTSDVRDVVCNLCENLPLSQYEFLFSPFKTIYVNASKIALNTACTKIFKGKQELRNIEP